ncbi:hypothetical protein B7486_42445 [cyanobacterium TDX16]|nr:hypothetical protein B7486_42445 [cyanobacterium TDX16]
MSAQVYKAQRCIVPNDDTPLEIAMLPSEISIRSFWQSKRLKALLGDVLQSAAFLLNVRFVSILFLSFPVQNGGKRPM